MEVFRGSGECETSVVFSGEEATVKIGPFSELAWASTTQIRTVRPDQYREEIGYLNGPYNSSPPSGISNAAFDRFLNRGAQCKEACATIGARANNSRALAVLEPEASAGMQYFSEKACQQSCMKSGGYRSCLAGSMKIRGPIDFLYAASECEQRRPD